VSESSIEAVRMYIAPTGLLSNVGMLSFLSVASHANTAHSPGCHVARRQILDVYL
jgi:hypothetical protein